MGHAQRQAERSAESQQLPWLPAWRLREHRAEEEELSLGDQPQQGQAEGADDLTIRNGQIFIQ